jgi:hypothetical protein
MLEYAAEITPARSADRFAWAAPFSQAGRRLIGKFSPSATLVYLYLYLNAGEERAQPRFSSCTHQQHS